MRNKKGCLFRQPLLVVSWSLVDKDDHFIVVHLDGSRVDRQRVGLVVQLFELRFGSFDEIEVWSSDFDFAFLQDGNDRCVMIEELKASVDAGKGYRSNFAFEECAFRRNDF